MSPSYGILNTLEFLMFYLSVSLISLGVVLLCLSLCTTWKLLSELPPGSLKVKWFVLFGLIGFFLVGYLCYLALCFQGAAGSAMTVCLTSVILSLGSVFVWLVSKLALETVTDIKRMHTLEQENITDPLMNIYNRRYLMRRLEEEFSRAQRYGLPFSLLLFDLDHFKSINDTHGHQTGDVVLQGTARLLKENIRKVDIPARYGGEEIVVLLPSTDAEGAKVIAERLRQKIEACTFSTHESAKEQREFQCTTSIGCASLTDDTPDGKTLLEHADQALYKAKESGRNQVVVYA